MSMRVATFALTDRLLDSALRVQARMADKQIQQASGLVAQDYAGLGADARRLVDLQVSIARSESYQAAAATAKDRVEAMYGATTAMTDLLTEFRASLASISSSDSSLDLRTEAEALLEEFAALLNTQFEGRYLFAGDLTTTKPVDLAAYSMASPTTADTGYYRGDATAASVKVGESRTITYGVTGDAAAFEQAMRALAYAADNDLSSDSAALAEVSALVVEALDAITAVSAGLGVDAAALERVIASEEEHAATLSDLASTISEVDVAVVAVELSAFETQLQASYAALGKLTSLSLLDYLR